MARFMLALLGGGRLGEVAVVSPASAQAFRAPILAAPRGINGWAHGFMIEDLGGRRGFGHAGATLAFRANLAVVPELGLGVFVAANTYSGEPLVRDLPRALVREFYGAPAPVPATGSDELAREPGRFAGHYLSTRRAYGGLQGFVARLRDGADVGVTAEGRLTTRTSRGSAVWLSEGSPAEGRFASLAGDERLAFRMRDGRADAFAPADGTELFERISFWRSPQALRLVAALAGAAAVLTLAGAALRNRRELRENPVQSRAGLIQNLQGGLWLLGMALFAAWLVRARDPAALVFGWPHPLLIVASACALVAAALTVTTIVALPSVWRGGRRVDSWPVLRRAAFTVTVAVYAVFAVLLIRAGALAPWSG